MKKRTWSKDERVIYGGSLKAGVIRDLSYFNKTAKVNPQQLIVFACGLTSRDDLVKIQEIKKANHLESIPFYYFPGGVDYSQLGFASKSLLKMICKSIRKDPQGDQMMAARLEKSGDYTDLNLLKEMIQQINNK
ncbi:MAG: flavodoxin domain-containing protein [Beduini sp.]|uniref:flavodoxin domain-containing protein n=1 Tax=Beduini sp. TaxID=1922300 RepID=UPI0039A2025C